MSDKYLGQIMFSGYNFAPRGQAFCNGQTIGVLQNQALFALIGTFYGGNGVTTFALPDLRGRSPLGFGGSADPAWQPPARPIAAREGAEQVTLQTGNLPPHTHALNAISAAATQSGPSTATFAASDTPVYANDATSLVALGAATSSLSGGGQAHVNMQPFTVVSATIVIEGGFFPSRQ